MRAAILFPGDYFSLNAPNDNFRYELDTVIAAEGLEAALFNFDDYIEGDSLALSKPAEHLPKLVIYRGWMMKPEQYRRFHDDSSRLDSNPWCPLCAMRGCTVFPMLRRCSMARPRDSWRFPRKKVK